MPKIKKFDSIRFDYPADPFNFNINEDYEKDKLGGWIEIKYVREGERVAITQKARGLNLVYKNKEAVISGDLNTILDREETAATFISDWGNFFDDDIDKKFPDGHPLPCTDSNKRWFSGEDGFMAALNKFIDKADTLFKERKDAAAKN